VAGQSDLRELKVDDLDLDVDNPRFFHLMHRGRTLTQEEIEQEILKNDEDLPLLTKSIQKDGVKDPIWVIRKNNRYLLLEGNRRTVVLRQLLKQKTKPPAGIRYDIVEAHVMPSDTSPVEQILQKARLQAGKKAWGPFNEAALTYQLREAPHLMAFEDIAVDLKIPVTRVKERIQNYKLFKEYVEETKDDNPKRFAYFAECPPKVREWFLENDRNKKEFFRLICPVGGKNKIKSVATRGGLRDFAKVVQSAEALKLLTEDPSSTVEDALDLAKEADIRKAIPFINKVGPLTQDLRALDASQLERLKSEVRFKVNLRALRLICEEVLAKLES
jgi:hypothetical protein